MVSKFFEVRGRGTYWAVVATELGTANAQEQKILRSTGEGPRSILISKMDSNTGGATASSHRWPDPIMQEAAEYIEQNFHSLTAGQVIDVDFINGRTTAAVQTQFP